MAAQTTSRPPASCPTLESGDRLTRQEFHRRYLQRPDIKKAELINGVVYVASPVRLPHHGEPHILLAGEFAAYRRRRKGVRVGDNSTVRFPDGSDVQPDCLLAFRGGTSIIDDEGYVIGVPELCAEIAASSVSYDLHDKKELYRRMGVREYIVWRVEDEAVDWWKLVDGAYVPLPADEDGVVHSEVFAGFAIDVPALLAAAREGAEA